MSLRNVWMKKGWLTQFFRSIYAKAFDTVDHTIILSKLDRYGICLFSFCEANKPVAQNNC